MELTVGTVVEGKIKSITNFGAFVALAENKTGMVHISEVANTYVSDIRQHLWSLPTRAVRSICPSSAWRPSPRRRIGVPDPIPVLPGRHRLPLPLPRRRTSSLKKS